MRHILRLFYVSDAADPCEARNIRAILAASRRNNARHDVTGCLLFSGRHFAQVLEGEPGVVRSMAARIASDPRHRGLQVLDARQGTQRQYDEWSMGYLHDSSLGDALEALLRGPERPAAAIADVLRQMHPDIVTGSLR